MNDLASAPNSDNRNARQLVSVAQAGPVLRDPYGRFALYGGDVPEDSMQIGVLLLEYWRILYKRKWLILGVATAFVVLAALRTLMQTPFYTSTVRLQIDPPEKVVEGGNVSEDYGGYQFM